MRDNVWSFVRLASRALELAGPVYEFGSYQVPGHAGPGDIRPLFAGRKYIGCDLRPGPGVDRLEDLGSLSLPDECAGAIVCVDTLEHVFEARKAVDEMIRVLAPGGVLLAAAPMNFRIHDHPDDYWRFTPSCLQRLLAPLDATLIGSQGVESFPHTVLAIGCKAPVAADTAARFRRFMAEYDAWLVAEAAKLPWKRKLKRRLAGWLSSLGSRRNDREYFTARYSLRLSSAVECNSFAPDGPEVEPAALGSRVDLS